MLREHVRIYRWTAVGVGFIGVMVMLWPHLDLLQLIGTSSETGTVGAMCALASAFTNAGSVIQTRRLTNSETTASIVFYFSFICAIAGLATAPFGWISPTTQQLAALVGIGFLGGVAHMVLTESYRYAAASVVAPFDYTAMPWAFLFGYTIFGEVPTVHVFIGAAIVAAAGLFVIWRERRRGIERLRTRAIEGPPVGE